ncbi:fused signal recognition particle receptor [Bathymodiolus platifrons methanotrophic gill symbiont]|uniref:signal recognition particle-docking protein FtsY n=1 Tax=Bathymodiolus platifrons methanotrophic gill symbiont TaxID=113268 RepID=UPI000B41F738|nr:signal recognition particle-docking protein FtsY [Bathymodiolus platifrons methanotrophic gill symbiont]MCK5869220.1 signal recognition particle-docking protein FtsY [Methyloprofundus sp.]TXK96630.1 signal recognition particle-docking protein FtsY [Methylococcaceae bacterium CS4]TXK99853.1 signal recognition particle-docking protein FtsY [Methylococcaceae bacterium CS5]TXL06478.1 signal recognition particle-docking protein FtsY [Methylococcaceae bacterium CS1]TXL07239.1 signal recognition p
MFRFSTLLVCFFTLLTTVSGALQRFAPVKMQSCSEYSSCYAQINQIFSQATIGLYDIAWLIHSLSALAVILFVAVMLLTSFWSSSSRVSSAIWALVLAGIVGLQIQLGIYQTLASQALTHFVHYLLTALMLFIAFHIYIRSKTVWVKRGDGKKLWLISVAILVLGLQLILGAWLAANNAGLVCGEFPRCLGSWWPAADYQYALNIFSSLSFSAKVAVHWLHRVLSVVVFITLTWVMLTATASRIKQVRWAGAVVSGLLLVQIASGMVLVKLALPVWVVAVHGVVAIVLMLPLLAIRFYTKYQALEDLSGEAQQQDIELPEVIGQEPIALEVSKEFPQLELVEPESLYLRLKTQLGKTRTGLGAVLSVVSGNRAIDQDLLEEIETSLLMADVGMEVTSNIIAKLEESVEKHQLQDVSALQALLKQQLLELLEPVSQPLLIPEKLGPYVILVVGVNGVGKTTTIGKLAQRLQQQGHSVMLAAGDTFRAAAVEQLQIWGERNDIHVVAQHTGADSASVIFDGVQSAQAKGIDVLIADTAGRLHTKANLMQELSKIKRIMAKLDDTAPHEVLLVLDAGTGQNALSQAENFNKSVALTGIALTKLDGTAKGGMIFALAKQIGVPIRFLGVGEGINDLQDFNAEQFIDALFVSVEQ